MPQQEENDQRKTKNENVGQDAVGHQKPLDGPGVVQLGKGLTWDWHVQKLTQWLPSLSDIENEQLILGHSLQNVVDPTLIIGHGFVLARLDCFKHAWTVQRDQKTLLLWQIDHIRK